MVTRVQRWGNSQGLRLARQILEDARIGVGDEVEVTVQDGRIVIAPSRHVRGRHNLQDLVSRIPTKHMAGEVDWGPPTGKEMW